MLNHRVTAQVRTDTPDQRRVAPMGSGRYTVSFLGLEASCAHERATGPSPRPPRVNECKMARNIYGNSRTKALSEQLAAIWADLGADAGIVGIQVDYVLLIPFPWHSRVQ